MSCVDVVIVIFWSQVAKKRGMGFGNTPLEHFHRGTYFAKITGRSRRDIAHQTMNGDPNNFLTMVSVSIFLLFQTSIILLVYFHHAMVNWMEITNIQNDLVMHTTNVRMEWLLLWNAPVIRFLILQIEPVK